jgi:methylmalonyl-CoA/ethylmalonyl-CoA epimerase
MKNSQDIKESVINAKLIRRAYLLAFTITLASVPPLSISQEVGPGLEPIFKDITEIVMVVENLDESVKKQWEIFGIGPWEIWTLDASTVNDMSIRGTPEDFSIRIAYTKIGNIHWELIEPLDKTSTYYEFLQTHGEGVHNIVFEVTDYDEASTHMKKRGIVSYNSGNWQGVRFINFDTRGVLPVIAELFHVKEGASFPPPERTYP